MQESYSDEEDVCFDDLGLEIIEEVNQDTPPGNDIDFENVDTKEDEASCALRPLACGDWRGGLVGVSETELATVSVMAAFLAVHPMGASIEEITTYMQGFDHSYTGPYLESLLQKLIRVFQICHFGDGTFPGKWCFLGFQTCAAGKSRATNSATN